MATKHNDETIDKAITWFGRMAPTIAVIDDKTRRNTTILMVNHSKFTAILVNHSNCKAGLVKW